MAFKNGMNPVHPGLVLRDELDDIGLPANALAKAISVPANRVTAILNGERGISADTALRLSRYFDTTAQFWLNLQQAWQIRRAESRAGSRILDGVVPRHAEVLRTAAQQVRTTSDQTASMLKSIQRNVALCEQISAAERSMRMLAGEGLYPPADGLVQRMRRALASPLDELQRTGVLYTAFGRQLKLTNQWLTSYERRFQLVDANKLSQHLGAMEGSTLPASTIERLAAMRTPWLDIENERGSIERLAGLLNLGDVIGNQAAFSQSAAAKIRTWLGDWRDTIMWPDQIWQDMAARADHYDGLGFDANLTDMPAAAFREATGIANIGTERPSLVESFGPPVPSFTPDEEAAFARTNRAHDWLQRFESHMRRFVDVEMTRVFGPDWPRHQLPKGLYDRWQEKKSAAVGTGAQGHALIAYADFTDYAAVIMRKDNWRQVFSAYFDRGEDVRESFQRLHPIRLDTMHARPVGQDDELLLYVEVKRLLRAIET